MSKKKNKQIKLINELESQLLIQAERLGVRDRYTPLAMEEMGLDAVRTILTEFYMERANLEYEMSMTGTNKKELLIKLEKLHGYIRKAESLRDKHLAKVEALLDKELGDQKKVRRALKKVEPVRVQAAA
ncbi:MAG: hypothetical protein U9R38_02375 [Candidatus Margulisiibacteriota bacterium]|nr:hypothetical protein [Candidatus Margulisiibacteriota bacterium]